MNKCQHDRGTDRLIRDIRATKEPTPAEVAAAKARSREIVKRQVAKAQSIK